MILFWDRTIHSHIEPTFSAVLFSKMIIIFASYIYMLKMQICFIDFEQIQFRAFSNQQNEKNLLGKIIVIRPLVSTYLVVDTIILSTFHFFALCVVYNTMNKNGF